jgi:hypothetical protein
MNSSRRNYGGLRRAISDIRDRRHLEAYALFVLALFITILNLVDIASSRVVNSVILACLAFLIYRLIGASSQPRPSVDAVLFDRSGYEPFIDFISGAKELCMFAPIGINSIPRYGGDIQRLILARGGRARIIVMDPSSPYLNLLSDQTVRYGGDLSTSLATTVSVLQKLSAQGNLEYRLLHFNPGFNLTIRDPAKKDGRVIVEFTGFKEENVNDRMHIEIDRSDSLHWFEYWVERFELMWEAARRPD